MFENFTNVLKSNGKTKIIHKLIKYTQKYIMHCHFKRFFWKMAPNPRVYCMYSNKKGFSFKNETIFPYSQRESTPKSSLIWLFTFFLKVCMLSAPRLFIG
jgi:hypothetical protein